MLSREQMNIFQAPHIYSQTFLERSYQYTRGTRCLRLLFQAEPTAQRLKRNFKGKATFSFYFHSLPLSEPFSLPSFQSPTGNWDFHREIPKASKPNVRMPNKGITSPFHQSAPGLENRPIPVAGPKLITIEDNQLDSLTKPLF